MPLIRHDHLSEMTAELGIWQITEPEGWFMEELPSVSTRASAAE